MTPSTLQVATLTVHLGAVLKGVFDEGMIEDLGKGASPPIRISEPPMPFALTGYMPLIQQPDVQIVNVLLANLVSGCPGKVVPIVHLVFHFGHAVLLGGAKCHLHSVDSQKVDVSDRTVLNA